MDSTNAEAARLAGTTAGPVWIVAERQSAGRGRRGRAWQAPAQALLTTLLLYPDDPPATAALRSFVAAVALRDALVTLGVAGDAVTLKWPNDVLLDGGKVAGILLERGQAGPMPYLAIGIGVNLAAAPAAETPQGPGPRPIAVADTLGHSIDPDTALIALAEAYAQRETQVRTYGFGPIRTAWMTHAARLGQPITARTVRDEVQGVFEGSDGAGNLLLRTAAGPVVLPAADVYF